MTRSVHGPALAALGLFVSLAPARGQQVDAAPGPQLEVAAGEVSLAELVERWAALRRQVALVDPQVAEVHARFAAPARLDGEALGYVLEMNDVVLVERDGVLEAHHRRNVGARLSGPWEHVEGLAPDAARPVTVVVPIRHGAGQAIFSALRGLMTRDLNRLGNLLHVPGADVIVIADLAANVRRYQELIAELDRPPAFARQRTRFSVHEVPSAWWDREQEAAQTPAALIAALRAAAADPSSGVTELAEVAARGGEPATLERLVPLGEGDLTASVRLTYGPPAPATEGAAPQVAPGDASGVLRVQVDLLGGGAITLRLAATTRVSLASERVVESFAGRHGPDATDVVVVVERLSAP